VHAAALEEQKKPKELGNTEGQELGFSVKQRVNADVD
jgi:hypothetical protein